MVKHSCYRIFLEMKLVLEMHFGMIHKNNIFFVFFFCVGVINNLYLMLILF